MHKVEVGGLVKKTRMVNGVKVISDFKLMEVSYIAEPESTLYEDMEEHYKQKRQDQIILSHMELARPYYKLIKRKVVL